MDDPADDGEVTNFGETIGGSLAMLKVYELIRRAAAVDLPVLIEGETGVGKELAALAIHSTGPRRDGPFVPVNMGGLSQTLAASALFGHEKGAFTGADEAREGHFERAEGGTLFLDEIGTMGRRTQASLLRVLEARNFRRVGSGKLLKANARIIAATNQDLRELVKKGLFLDSLLFRFDVLHIHLPALREREGDVELLAHRFVQRFAPELKSDVRVIAPEALELLKDYHWHGNVRELKNVIQQAIVLANSNDIITPECLPERLRQPTRPPAKRANPEDLVALIQHHPPAEPGVSLPLDPGDGNGDDVIQIPMGMSLADVQKVLINKTLRKVGGNKARAARILGISRKSLYSKLAQLGIEESE